MRVTNTKIETTLYDTNGKLVSIVKKEVVEVDTQPHLLNREETKFEKERAKSYKENLSEAKKIKDNLERVHGVIKGGRIFRDMSDLDLMIKNPENLNHVPESTSIKIVVKKIQPISKSIWDKANEEHNDFQQGLTKKRGK